MNSDNIAIIKCKITLQKFHNQPKLELLLILLFHVYNIASNTILNTLIDPYLIYSF